MDLVDEAGLEQDGVGDDEDALGPEPPGDLAELAGGAAAEEELLGGVERPDGALHGRTPRASHG